MSTWVASLLGLLGLHVILREMGERSVDALMGVAFLAFYPVYFIFSFSFRTEVLFVAVMIWCFAALARARKRGSPRHTRVWASAAGRRTSWSASLGP